MPNTELPTVKSKRITTVTWIVAVWVLGLLVGLAIRLGWMPLIDLSILTWIRDNQVEGLQQFMYIITMGGYWPAYVIILAILALILIPKKQLPSWLILAVNAALTWGMHGLIKAIFQRELPLDFFQMEQGGFSYPSGHDMVSVAYYF